MAGQSQKVVYHPAIAEMLSTIFSRSIRDDAAAGKLELFWDALRSRLPFAPESLRWNPIDPDLIASVGPPRYVTPSPGRFVCDTDARLLWIYPSADWVEWRGQRVAAAEVPCAAVPPVSLSRFGVGKRAWGDHLVPVGFGMPLGSPGTSSFAGGWNIPLGRWGSGADPVVMHGPMSGFEDLNPMLHRTPKTMVQQLARGTFDTTRGCIGFFSAKHLMVAVAAREMGCLAIDVVGTEYRNVEYADSSQSPAVWASRSDLPSFRRPIFPPHPIV